MNIGINEIKKVLLGALRVYEDGEYIAFSRFTESQIKRYTERNFTPRQFSTAGMKLEFYTYGGRVSFDYEIIPGTLREYYSIDLVKDGVFNFNISEEAMCTEGHFSCDIEKAEKEQRITVYFPTTAGIKIKNLRLPSDFKPHRRKMKILFLGDSKVQGYYPNHFQYAYTNVLSDYFDADSVNQAVGGEIFRKDNIEKIDYDCDVIIVSYGVNDWSRGIFGNGEEADAYLSKLASVYPDKKIILLLPSDHMYLEKKINNPDLVVPDGEKRKESAQTIDDVRCILFKISEKYTNVVSVNTNGLVPQIPEVYYKDNVHYNDFGNYIFGSRLSEKLNEEKVLIK